MSTDTPRGKLFILVAPGGAGKNKLMNRALKRIDNFQLLATATTRDPREGERHGREHLFVNKEEFEAMRDQDAFIETTEVTKGRWYGTPKSSVEIPLSHGKNLISDIDVRGASIVKQAYPEDVYLIYIDVPGKTIEDKLDTLRQRMENRDDATTKIDERLNLARDLELPFRDQYRHLIHYVIVNDILEEATDELVSVIEYAMSRQSTE